MLMRGIVRKKKNIYAIILGLFPTVNFGILILVVLLLTLPVSVNGAVICFTKVPLTATLTVAIRILFIPTIPYMMVINMNYNQALFTTTFKIPEQVAGWALHELGVSFAYVTDYDINRNVYLYRRGLAPKLITCGSPLWNTLALLETKRNLTVYAVIHDTSLPIGENYSFLCVSPYPEDWCHMVHRHKYDQFIVYAYVQNMVDDCLSKSGSVFILSRHNSMVRLG